MILLKICRLYNKSVTNNVIYNPVSGLEQMKGEDRQRIEQI